MILPIGLQISANGAPAISQLRGVGQALREIGQRPATMALTGLDKFAARGREVTGGLIGGLREAESAWYRLGGALGVPMSLAGVLAAATGMRTLKTAFVDANMAMETARVQMAGRLRDWNDTADSARLKAMNVTRDIEQYAKDTPFDTAGLNQAAVSIASFTKDPEMVMKGLKLAGRLAASRNETDPSRAAYSLESAMSGNYESLHFTYGINANADTVNSVAASLGYNGGTALGRYMAIQKLIEQKTGGAAYDPVKALAQTGAGAWSTFQDTFAIEARKMSEGGYAEGVKALNHINDSLAKFTNSPAYIGFRDTFSARYAQTIKTIGEGVGMLTDRLAELPGLVEKYQPMLLVVGKVAAGLGAIHLASLAAKFGLGTLVTTGRALLGAFSPLAAIVTNPGVVLGLGLIASAMYPFAKSLDVGGKSVEAWMDKFVAMSRQYNWEGLFLGPIKAVKELVGGEWLKGGRLDIRGWLESAFGDDGLPAKLLGMIEPPVRALGKVLREQFPAETAFLGRLVSGVRDNFGVFSGALRSGLDLTRRLLGDLMTHAVPSFQVTEQGLRSFAQTAGGVAAKALDALNTGLAFLVSDVMPRLRPAMTFLGDHAGALTLFAGGLLGLSAAGRALSLLGPVVPLLTGLGRALAPVLGLLGGRALAAGSGALGAFGAIGARFSGMLGGLAAGSAPLARILQLVGFLAGPMKFVGLAALAGSLFEVVRGVDGVGPAVDGALSKLRGLSEGVDWKGIFLRPINFFKDLFNAKNWAAGGKFDAHQFWKNLFAPDALISQIKGIIRPVFDGLLAALDEAFPGVNGYFKRNFGDTLDTITSAMKAFGDVAIPVVTGFLTALKDMASAAMPVLGGLAKFAVALIGPAWKLIGDTFRYIATALGTPGGAAGLEKLGAGLAAAAVGVGAVKVGTTVASAASGAAGAAGGALGSAAKWLASPAGLAIAALTITAASVALYTNKINENVNAQNLWNLVSGLKSMDGRGFGQYVASLDTRKAASTADGRASQANTLGLLSSVSGRDVLGRFLQGANLNERDQRDFLKNAGTGTVMGDRVLQAVQTLVTKSQSGQLTLNGKEQGALTALTTAQDKLQRLTADFMRTGNVDEKQVARLLDVVMRNTGYLRGQGLIDRSLIPDELIPAVRFMGLTLNEGLNNPGSLSEFDAGGGGAANMDWLPPSEMGGQGTAMPMPDVKVTVPLTVYSEGGTVDIDETYVARRVEAALRDLLPKALYNAMQGQK